jgi:thymidylate synthase ThyX
VDVRETRRDKLARAFENVSYTFDLLVNFGIYRDLQRHRVLTQERQLFTCEHGWDTPPEIKECGLASHWLSLLGRAADAQATVAKEMPLEAQYLVPFASRVRWYVTLNLREAVHLVELRSMPQGHPDYRRVVQTMWSEIERVHPALAGVARFLNRDTYRLGRLQSELRSEHKRAAWGSME